MSFPQHSAHNTAPPRDYDPHFQCIHCSHASFLSQNVVDLYLRGQHGICEACRAQLDWWKIVVHVVQQNFMLSDAFFPLGAKLRLFQTTFFRDGITHFNLYEEGLPDNALILEVNLTPKGMYCSEVAANSRRMRHKYNKGGDLQLHGYADPGSDSQINEAEVAIFVTWVESSVDDVAWNNLVTAFDFYVNNDYESSLVPANVAVESRLFRLVERHLTATASKDRVKDFLESGATYSHQLNVLLPSIVHQLRATDIADDLRGRLNRLRELRNQVAHRGRCDHKLSQNQCAELITPALFGFRYLGSLDSCIRSGD